MFARQSILIYLFNGSNEDWLFQRPNEPDVSILRLSCIIWKQTCSILKIEYVLFYK